ncbi:MAG: triose-phosphate isomerase [Tissierellia bacterium]|nr:triose-phosphate isomerase [Tissierellia bacterium]
MRTPIIAGNWKMNKGVKEAQELIEEIKKLELSQDVETLVCPPFVDLQYVSYLLEDTSIQVGAQNMHYEESGAFTGEVSPTMLRDMGISYVILGHSERREYFNESDELVNKKVLSALEHDLNPIICCGETLDEREAGKEEDKVRGQIVKALEGVKEADFDRIVIAYEPIWAIGTGRTASSDDAEKMCAFIRDLVREVHGENASQAVRIQYGGSVKPANIKEIMSKDNIDGALVGGASLEAESFGQLINF